MQRRTSCSKQGLRTRFGPLLPLVAVALGVIAGASLFHALRPESAAESRTAAARAARPSASPASPAVQPIEAPRGSAAPAPARAARPARAERSAVPAARAFSALRRDAETPRVIAPPVYHPRPEHEWQGMLVDLSRQPGCGRVDGCGFGMACVENQCGPCESDDQCGGGELCVLDHCVPARHVECRSARDCGEDALCVLSDYSDGPRGNDAMTATCQRASGGDEEEVAEEPDVPDDAEIVPRPVSLPALRASLLEELGLLPADDPIHPAVVPATEDVSETPAAPE